MTAREPMTLRKLIAKLQANSGDKGDAFLDLPLTFRVYDGYRHAAYEAMYDDAWPHLHYGYRHLDLGDAYRGELRFDVCSTGHRLVKERAR